MWFEHADRGMVRTTGKHTFSAAVTAYANSAALMLLSFVGAATAVDAIRANASMGKPLSLMTLNPNWTPGQHWSSREAQYNETMLTTKDQKYKLFKHRLSNIAQDHYLLINRVLLEPDIKEGTVYAWGEIETPQEDVIGAMLRRVTPLGIFPSFYAYLVTRATENRSIWRLSPQGGTQVWGIRLGEHWEQWLSEGLKSGAIQMPEDTHV